jgi:hypothetical protein
VRHICYSSSSPQLFVKGFLTFPLEIKNLG